ncbi:HTH domain-containing protein [Halobacteriales archaeon Cl-PHB]
MSGSHAEGVQVEVFVRSLAPIGAGRPQKTVVRTLERLTDRGTVDDYRVTVCGKEVPADRDQAVTAFCERLLDCVDAFEAWAERNDRALHGVFDRKEAHSSITGEDRVYRVAPVLAVAEYEGTDLRFVAPSVGDGRQVSVIDRLEELEGMAEFTDAEPLPDVRDETHTHRPPTVAQ